MILAALIAFSVTFTGGLARELGDVLGLGATAVDVWGWRSGRCCCCS